MGKDNDRPTFDATATDRRRAFKFFIANFRDYCIMEDYVNSSKVVDSDDYWIEAKRPKALAALRRAFPQGEWDVLTTTIDSQIPSEDKQHPAKWLARLTHHYLGEEPIIQSTHHFLRILKQATEMSIQEWHTLVRLEYQKCNFPSAVDDRLQRDIFVIGLNDTFKRFRGDVISRDNFVKLTFAEVITKARDFEDGLKTESAITQNQLEETAHKVVPKPSQPRTAPLHRTPASRPQGSTACLWCGGKPHTSRRECPASNATCHRCEKRGHWQKVCKASSANMVSDDDADTNHNLYTAYVATHEVHHVQSPTKGHFVDLELSSSIKSSAKHFNFQVDTGCSCNTMHITDLHKLSEAKITPSTVRLLDYSKDHHPY